MSSEMNRTCAAQDADPRGVQLHPMAQAKHKAQGHGTVNQSLACQSPRPFTATKAGPAPDRYWSEEVGAGEAFSSFFQYRVWWTIAGLGYSAYFTVAVSQ